MQQQNIWVWAEQRDGQLPEIVAEAMGAGASLAAEKKVDLCAVLLGYQVEHLAEQLFALGAATVYLVDNENLSHFDDHAYACTLNEIIVQQKPGVLLAGATSRGKSLFPRLACLSKTGLSAECTMLSFDDNTGLLLQTRPSYGGNIMATIICPHTLPQMATIRPRVMRKAQYKPGQTGNLVKPNISNDIKPLTKFIETVVSEKEDINLTAAEIVVVGGGGLGKAAGFDLVRKLAKALGAVVGASRRAVDSEWISHDHQVGQTGKTVNPKLYIGLGVYGAVQHQMGMRLASTIVAINTNPDAPIFEIATYGIVGDLYEVVPAMLQRIKECR